MTSINELEYDLNNILDYLDKETEPYWPKSKDMFRSFIICPYNEFKVVILGQDPYYTKGVATGLCFDSDPPQPSLKNILKEIGPGAIWGDELANQGVLLLNTALTVLEGKPGSHLKLWEDFTLKVIEWINSSFDNIVWMLWGSYSKGYSKYVTNTTHLILKAGHPSPLNTSKDKFLGCNHFSLCNDFLESKGLEKIKWKKD